MPLKFPVRGGGRFPRPFGVVNRPKLSAVADGTEVLLATVMLVEPRPMNLEVAAYLPSAIPEGEQGFFAQLPDMVQLRIVTSKNKDDYPDAIYRMPSNGFSLNVSAKSAAIWAKHDLRQGLAVTPAYEYFLGAGISPGIVRRNNQTDSWKVQDVDGTPPTVYNLPMPAYARSIRIDSSEGSSSFQWLNNFGQTLGMDGFFLATAGETVRPVPARASGLSVTTTLTESSGQIEWGF